MGTGTLNPARDQREGRHALADTKEKAHTKASSLSKLSRVCRGTMPSLPPPPGGLGWYRRSLASPHPPSVLWEGEEPQKPSLPSSPLSPPPRGGLLQFVVTALHVRKKKVCRMSHTEKKNAKPREKNLRVGLADGIIKASPEPRLALPLRQPLGEEPRPVGPAPSPMDLRAGRSQASEASASAPAQRQ